MTAKTGKPRSAEIPPPIVTVKSSEEMRDQQQAQHSAMISLIIKNTGKIQKEIGFRRPRLKVVHTKCKDAIDALTEFKDEEWSLKDLQPIATPGWSKERSSDPDVVLMEEPIRNRESSSDTESMAETCPDTDFERETTTSIEEGSLDSKPNGHINGTAASESFDSVEVKADSKSTGSDDVGDDAVHVDKREVDGDNSDAGEMHSSVKIALSCYCIAITHSQKTPKMVEIALECIALLITNRYVVGSTTKKNGEKEKSEERGSEIQYLITCICESSDANSDSIQTAMAKALLALLTSPVCAIHEASMLKAVRTVFHIYLVSKQNNTRVVSKAVLLDMLRSVFSRMEAYHAMIQGDGSDDEIDILHAASYDEEMKASKDPCSIFAERFQTDSYLLFRALCKLSAKQLPEDSDNNSMSSSKKSIFSSSINPNTNPDAMATSTKTLSLELILSIFENCGPAFRGGEKFIYAVQNFLCVSLLKNSMSNNTAVAHLSLKVFLLLVYKFKEHLKSEIEVFVANVFLPVLESPNSPFERKSLVLEALRALCSDPQILTQIFLNYDCDFDAVNLYKKIIHNLTSLSVRGRSTQEGNSSKAKTLSLAGLEVLVVTLQAFLKALNLPGGNDIFIDENEGLVKIRGNLQIDVGTAIKSSIQDSFVKNTEELDVSAKEIEKLEQTVPGAPQGNVAGKIEDAFDRKRIAQQNFELGCVKFTLSPKKGLLFFIEHGLLHMDAKEIALFVLEHKDRLDKTQIGEIFGREPDACFVKDDGTDPEKGGEGFYIRVLHHYVDALDFSGLKFDESMRIFLSGFRLPGESQKVDRIMEKFAERYTLQNEDVFPSADTAFILSFAVIMLQTDLHNPNIKPEKKMTCPTFINLNSGISPDGDLPPEFLAEIFNSIKYNPFTLKEDDAARETKSKSSKDLFEINGNSPAFFGGGAEGRKRERFRKERAELMAASEELFKRQRPSSTTSVSSDINESVRPSDVVKPMFDVTWGPLIGALSQILELSDDDSSVALCLNGFVYSVRIAMHTGLSLARSTFITTLAKFTALGSIKEMKSKNIESIRTLLSIAVMDGEYLNDCWISILQCISQLGRLQLFASGLKSDDAFLNEEDPSNSRGSAGSKAGIARETEENNGKAVLEAINEVLIEKVFTSSGNLSDSGIIYFVDCLVRVSETEIDGGDSKKVISGVGRSVSTSDHPDSSADGKIRTDIEHDNGPRIFSLQKVVEVADYNMNIRSRLSWAKIWKLMAKHLVKIGCNENARVSMFAIDALRQLSHKFLEKAELADFNFQKLFLRPFLSIMENTQSREDIRELILQCVDNTMRSMSRNLRSGWKIFFSILTLSAQDPSLKINTFGLTILQRLLDEHLHEFCKGGGTHEESEGMSVSEIKERNRNTEDFIALTRASLAFIESEKVFPVTVMMRALCHIACYADVIAEGKVLSPIINTQTSDSTVYGYTYEGLKGSEAEEMVLWRPLLDGLMIGIKSALSSTTDGVGCIVQRGSVMVLRAILLRHGSRFSINQWSIILKTIILPSIRIATENDKSPVLAIISESPNVNNVDFLSEPLPLPKSADECLTKFSLRNTMEGSSQSRLLGPSELLAETYFADLRNGGCGDLDDPKSSPKKKRGKGKAKNGEDPFPDSWVATTAPIAIGMLSDVFCSTIIRSGDEYCNELWPIVIDELQQWATGSPPTEDSSSKNKSKRRPCEVLARIGCNELLRLSSMLLESISHLNGEESSVWADKLCECFADVLMKHVQDQNLIYSVLADRLHGRENGLHFNEVGDNSAGDSQMIRTPFGVGVLTGERIDRYNLDEISMKIVQLESGATLYGPFDEMDQVLQNDVNSSDRQSLSLLDTRKLIRHLKVKCIATHCIQQNILHFVTVFSSSAGKADITSLLKSLEGSRSFASNASIDDQLSNHFEDSQTDWDETVHPGTSSDSLLDSPRILHNDKSKMFFLTQEAGSNDSTIQFLSSMYCSVVTDQDDWDRVSYAEPLLIARLVDVLKRFVASEKEDGSFLDPNVWHHTSGSGCKVAIYCTSFAGVVVNILNSILCFNEEQFERQKELIYPILCSLVKVQSSEIRSLLCDIFERKVSILLKMRE